MAPTHPLLALSDERDLWQRRITQAYREGFAAAERAHANDYRNGHHDGILGRKRFEHEWVEEARLELARWGPGGPEHFGDPRPGDYRGGPVDASWISAGYSLGPGPGYVHLSGRAVHWHKPCTKACSAYEAGWYTIDAAIAILATLPGDYAETIAELRAQAPAEGRLAA